MYSMMWPTWNGPLANGRAVVTKILRGIPLVYRSVTGHRRDRPAQGLADVLDGLELRLVDALLIGLFARDLARVQELLNGRVHRAHAELTAGLHHVLELVELALADEVGRGGCIHENLERGDATRLVGLLQQLLRDDAA